MSAPLIVVHKGNPDDTDLAALTVVVAALAAAPVARPPGTSHAGWAAPRFRGAHSWSQKFNRVRSDG
ncbi:Acyl-CoA carboxylase epsilon subunit [Amycolatopsis xylanica]|uniref:Acyl-CoA carboxylase epsilon subunit n=1 Tax=Amycolatopsis xylanica TaxID=589385 RepID=A0A1H3RDH7_9PSEU|nr:acyl-CoA carboxylase epsilon subunit [Amycolatopsis xylanica]SDZ23375.1 Acyl-CoA carboxylase epsilon subunit [Amycolatopsis xylanica]